MVLIFLYYIIVHFYTFFKADISNPARDISIAVPWAKRIQEEFWNQGDLLRVYNESAVIAPMNDRDYASITPTHESSLQIGFTLGLVKPLFELVSGLILVFCFFKAAFLFRVEH